MTAPGHGASLTRLFTIRQYPVVALACATIAATAGTAQASARPANPPPTAELQAAKSSKAFNVARRYTVRFYPRWFTWKQTQLTLVDRMVGPVRMSPIWGIVVAPNDDTIYTSAQINLRNKPQVLTIPKTHVTYSVLTLDVYGNIFTTKISTSSAGRYALVGPNWHGNLPSGVKEIRFPYDTAELIIRADRHTASGLDVTPLARKFRRQIHLTSLDTYRTDPTAGATLVAPELFTAPRLKEIADEAIQAQPGTFLHTLQRAMASKTTMPVSASDKRLIKHFNHLYNGANARTRGKMFLGAQVAHTQIVNRWQSHTGSTKWVNFNNIGYWGHNYLDRAALTEYVQLGNGASTAGYYDAFVDGKGIPLDCSVAPAYVLTFPKSDIPQAKRFWSLTAYLPESVTLVPNSIDKYLVGSYTPGLQTNSDGSISIYIQPNQPTTVPQANWLPVPDGPFNMLLRIYGPTGNTATGHYEPPAIKATFAR